MNGPDPSQREAAFEVVTIQGGARAMLDVRAGEVMHPHGGPRVEAEQLYLAPSRLDARLREATNDPLVLLDVGLGAGSNAIAAFRLSAARGDEPARPLSIVSFDHTLAALELALEEEHAEAFDLTGLAAEAARALIATGAHEMRHTRWRVVLGDLPGTLLGEAEACADVVFWDPFSPRTSSALWSVRAFTALRRLCRAGATVFTYSGATSTRAALLLAGFAVGLGRPTREDRTSTCAATCVSDLERPLDYRWLDRLRRSSAPLPSDAPADALDRIARLPQLAAIRA